MIWIHGAWAGESFIVKVQGADAEDGIDLDVDLAPADLARARASNPSLGWLGFDADAGVWIVDMIVLNVLHGVPRPSWAGDVVAVPSRGRVARFRIGPQSDS